MSGIPASMTSTATSRRRSGSSRRRSRGDRLRLQRILFLKRPGRTCPGRHDDPAPVGGLGVRRGLALRLRRAAFLAGAAICQATPGPLDPARDQPGRRAALPVRGALERARGPATWPGGRARTMRRSPAARRATWARVRLPDPLQRGTRYHGIRGGPGRELARAAGQREDHPQRQRAASHWCASSGKNWYVRLPDSECAGARTFSEAAPGLLGPAAGDVGQHSSTAPARSPSARPPGGRRDS